MKSPASIPDELHARCLQFASWRMAAERYAALPAKKADKLIADLRGHQEALHRLYVEAGALFHRRGGREFADPFVAYRQSLSDAASALFKIMELQLPADIDERLPPPAHALRHKSEKSLKPFTMWVLQCALEWKAHGINPSHGRKGKDDYRVGPFQNYLWKIHALEPSSDPRFRDRRKFAISVESALSHLTARNRKLSNKP